jgi:hypothetical protein
LHSFCILDMSYRLENIYCYSFWSLEYPQYLEESGRCWSKCLPGVLFMIHFHLDLKLGIIGSWFCNFFWSNFSLIFSSSAVTLYRLWLLNKTLKGTSKDVTSVYHHSFSFPTFEVSSMQVFEEKLKYCEVTLHTHFLKNY